MSEEETEYEEIEEDAVPQALADIVSYVAAIHERQASMGADLKAVQAQMKSDELLRLMVADSMLTTNKMVYVLVTFLLIVLAFCSVICLLVGLVSKDFMFLVLAVVLCISFIAAIFASASLSRHIGIVRTALFKLQQPRK